MQESPLPPWNRHHSPLYVSAIFTFRSQSRPRDKKSRARSRRSQNRALSVPPAFIRCPQCHSDSPPSLCEPGAPAPGYSPSPTRCCRASWWHRHLSLSSVAIRLHLSLFCSEHTSRTSKPKLELPRPHWSCTSSELSFPRARTYAASLKDPIRPRAARLGWRTALGQDACLGHDSRALRESWSTQKQCLWLQEPFKSEAVTSAVRAEWHRGLLEAGGAGTGLASIRLHTCRPVACLFLSRTSRLCSTYRSLLIVLYAHFPGHYQPLLVPALRLDHVTCLGRVTSLGLWSSNGGSGFHSATKRGLNWSLRVRVVASGVAVEETDAWRSSSIQSPPL
jgi:hypothetical protein